jgi:hypothetical protein
MPRTCIVDCLACLLKDHEKWSMRAVYTGCSFVQTHIRKERGRLTCDSARVATAAGTGEHRG